MPLFSRLKNKGAQSASKNKGQAEPAQSGPIIPAKPRWQGSWNSKTVELDEVAELIHTCTAEMKSRAEALNAPFMLLPFRPDTDASGARTFIRNYYSKNAEGSQQYRGSSLAQELRLTDAVVLCSILKWCWSRIPGGVVSWQVYEGFHIGERESQVARNAFNTFIPICADSEARRSIIFDFFDLIAAIAAHGKHNGLGGRKVSRLAGWWAFEHSDDGKGCEGGYKSGAAAADASSHLFFAYLRSLSPDTDPSLTVIERIPRSLQSLLASTEYPPETPHMLQRSTPRVIMLVDSVSPTPFALLRRAAHFEYRESDNVLRAYSEFDDPVDGLTDECKRVLYAISTVNSATPSSPHGHSVKTGQESWSAFQNLGFSDLDQDASSNSAMNGMNGHSPMNGIRASPQSRNNNVDRPTTPSWADFMSSGFANEGDARSPTTLSLPQQRLPPLGSRAQTPSSTMHGGGHEQLNPGEMAAIASVELDDAFWWVWMTSLSSEEPASRKGVFGRCAVIETTVMHGRWLIMEEQVKGASPDPTESVYIAPKKSLFSFTKRGKNKRTKSDKPPPASAHQLERVTSSTPSKSSIAPAQASKIKEAAAVLARNQSSQSTETQQRRGRHDDSASTKTSSMMTLGMMNEASPAMNWARQYDKKAIRAQYLGDSFAGQGASREDLSKRTSVNPSMNLMSDGASAITSPAPALTSETNMFPSDDTHNRELPALPKEHQQETPTAGSHPPADVTRPAEESMTALPAAQKSPTVHVAPADEADQHVQSENMSIPQETRNEAQQSFDKELAVDAPRSPTTRVGRKPVPSQNHLLEHPAFRQKSNDVESPPAEPNHQATGGAANPAAIAAQRAMSVRRPENGPKKQAGGGGGFKKLFGRKKDNNVRQSMDVQQSQSNANLTLPSDPNFARRLSLMRRKPARSETEMSRQQSNNEPAVNNEPTVTDSITRDEPSMTGASRIDTRSDADANEEFSRFDQGPVDMPAMTPEEAHSPHDYEELPAPAPQRHYNTQIADRIAPERQETQASDSFVTPMEMPTNQQHEIHQHEVDQNDAQSELTMDEPVAPAPVVPDTEPTQDRWAKIRENAARRAARASEEQSREGRPTYSTKETDDGETSGEETIESRVARIKARVAELTGNVDGAPRAVR